MTTRLQEKFCSASPAEYPNICPSVACHAPTDDVLACDGICHTNRPLCLTELKQTFAKHAASPAPYSMLIWARMARAALGEPAQGADEAPTPLSDTFEWSTPGGAMLVMTGKDHPHLSLPVAVYPPLSSDMASGCFHPHWIEEALGFISMQAVECSFEACVAVPRSTTPASRLNQINAITGLGALRVGNLATAGLSGLCYLAHNKPDMMVGLARAVSAFFNGLAYADELSTSDQGGKWSHLSNLAGPLLGAETLLTGPLHQIFERALLGYHCCTMRLRANSALTAPSAQTLFLARFYDSTLPAFLDCFKCLEPESILPARASTWGTLLSNDVFDYVSDWLSGRVANLCWAIGTWDSPILCARMFRGCVIAVAQAANYAPGPLFSLLLMEFNYLYTARYCYYSVPCDQQLPVDDTYIPFSVMDIPSATTSPVGGFRAALRSAFSESSGGVSECKGPYGVLQPWKGLAATPCDWDNSDGEFDVVAARATHDILGCLDRGVYVDSSELYYAHMGWLVRQYDALVACGRDNMGVGRYYVSHRVK